jgi:hypothetical protein
MDAIESWRARYLAAHRPKGQLAAEVAIGAVRSGSSEKPDLLPGLLQIFLYLVLLPDDDVDDAARDLARALAPTIAALPGAPTVDVAVYAAAPGARGDANSDIVRLVTTAASRHMAAVGEVREWCGATDGAIFLAAGIPTARVGPQVTRDEADPRIEIVSLDELLAATRAYVDVAIRYFAATA